MKEFYFKHIEIPNLDQILAEFKIEIDFNQYSEPFSYIDLNFLNNCTLFGDWCKKNNLEIRKAAIIMSDQKFNHFPPHIDSQDNALALNFPISNCEDSYTEFYEIPKNSLIITKKKENVLSKSIIAESFGNCITKYNLNSAVIINTHRPHKIVCANTKKRICLSIRFMKDPWHLVNE